MQGRGLQDLLGIEILAGGDGGPSARMVVTERCCQPYGYCSGGAMLTLEETLAGEASAALLGGEEMPLGVQVSANHLKAVRLGGIITAKATLLHRGGRMHVWSVDLTDASGDLVSTARVTNAIVRAKP